MNANTGDTDRRRNEDTRKKSIKKLVLIVSAGRTDLKLFGFAKGRWCAIELPRTDTRRFHEWLLSHPEAYRIEHRSAERDLYATERGIETFDLQIEGGDIRFKLHGSTSSQLAIIDGQMIVVPVKLGRLVALLQDQQAAGALQVEAVVVLNTNRRDGHRHAADEPFGNGPLLARWLGLCFGIEFTETQSPELGYSTWVDLLQGDESEQTGDSALNPAAVNRLIEVLRKFASRGTLWAALCGLGGMPRLKDLLRDAALFYFHQRCLLLEDPQAGTTARSPQIHELTGSRLTPEQSFALRSHVLQLIQAGDFIGAEASIRYVRDQVHAAWTEPVQTVARLFRGLGAARSDDQSSELQQQVARLAEAKVWCILPALRVEAALQSGSYVEAINSVATFFEVALVEALKKVLRGWHDGGGVTVSDTVISFAPHGSKRPKIPPGIMESRGQAQTPPLQQVGTDGLTFRWDLSGFNRARWIQTIDEPAYSEFYRAMYQRTSRETIPADYRNEATHSVLRPEDLEAALSLFATRSVWKNPSSEPPRGELLFLDHAPVRKMLRYLGVEALQDDYRRLVKLLTGCLRDFRWPETAAHGGEQSPAVGDRLAEEGRLSGLTGGSSP